MACNKHTSELVGNSMGKIKELYLDVGEVKWREYMRVRIKMDITNPLVRKKKFTIREMELMWIRFPYEHLSDFYFCCKIIGH